MNFLRLQTGTLQPDTLDSNPGSATQQLCDLHFEMRVLTGLTS